MKQQTKLRLGAVWSLFGLLLSLSAFACAMAFSWLDRYDEATFMLLMSISIDLTRRAK